MVPVWAIKYIPCNLISTVAERHKLDPYLVCAIVWKESRGDTFAVRFEPAYPQRYLVEVKSYARKNNISQDTERCLQMSSWGLMQVMGATARWLGYEKQISKLNCANVGLDYGCKYLAYQMKRYGVTTDAVAAYNRGSVKKNEDGTYTNNEYVADVMKYYNELRT